MNIDIREEDIGYAIRDALVSSISRERGPLMYIMEDALKAAGDAIGKELRQLTVEVIQSEAFRADLRQALAAAMVASVRSRGEMLVKRIPRDLLERQVRLDTTPLVIKPAEDLR